VLSYLGCDSSRYLSSLDSFALIIFTRGLPALVVSLAGAINAGRSSRGPGDGDPRKERTGGGESRRGLPRANAMVVLPWLSPFRPRVASGGVLGINLTLLSSPGVAGLAFPLLKGCSAFSALSLAARAWSASSGSISPLASARPCVFFCTMYFRFGTGLGLPIKSFYIAK
jgi:hypothetical protein